jgi:hypothetical protein
MKGPYVQVLAVLSADPESRNSDSRLICVLWNTYYPSRTLKTDRGDAVTFEDIISLSLSSQA